VAAIDQILEWGVPHIADTSGALANDIVRRGAALGLEAAPDALRARHYVGLRASRPLPERLSERLAADGIYVSVRGGQTLRVTPHVYNTAADVARLFEALERMW
jgi:selenocysteine lyase/cysteine desulfurase